MSEMTFDERKKILFDLVAELRIDADKILKVAPDSIPTPVKVLLKTSENEVVSQMDKLLSQVPEDGRAEFLEFLILATDQLRKGHADLMEKLSRRIQPKDEPRTPPRRFQGFKKRKGSW
jgi:hypothetical protein